MWGRLVAVALVAVIVQHVVRLLFLLNAFQKVINHAPGPCRSLSSIGRGSEDGYLLANGLMFVSSGFGRPPGKLFRLDMDSANPDVEEFLIEGEFDAGKFSAHGIGAWEDPKTGEVTLFAVNHHKDGDRVEVFRHDGSKTSKTLHHLKTIRDPKITFLNDVVATGPESFYATLFFSISMEADYLLMYSGGGIIRYDQGKTSVLVSGLFMANGINISPDKQYLYVAEGSTYIRTYRIQSDNTIREVQVYDTRTAPDNIFVDGAGDLWVGCTPNAYTAAIALSNPDKNYVGYSQVLRLRVDDGRIIDAKEVYANDGTEVSVSSVAIVHKKKLFIGTVMDGAIVCDLVYAD